MSGRVGRRGAVLLAAGVAGLAGCGVRGPAPDAAVPPASLPPAPPPLATSVAAGPVTWAVVPMGTAAAGAGRFWELFALAAGGTRWTLATPPDVATSGAIALAARRGGSLVTGIYPSQALRFSPVISTPDGGRTWAAGAPAPGLAAVPDALATAGSGTGLIALARGRAGRIVAIQGGQVQAGQVQAGQGRDSAGRDSAPTGRPAGRGGSWTTLANRTTLAATAAGRACGAAALTAAAFSPEGSPVLGADCQRPGVAGIFIERAGRWVAAGPPLSGGLRGRPVRVLRLTRVGGRLAALLQVGGGRAAALIAAWTTDGRTWMVSPPLPLAGAVVSSTAFGTDGTAAVGLGGRGAALVPAPGAELAPGPGGPGPARVRGRGGPAGPGEPGGPARPAAAAEPGRPGAVSGPWRRLPQLPAAPHVTLALPAGGGVVALAADGGVLTVWRLPAGGSTWTRTQRITVPLPGGTPG